MSLDRPKLATLVSDRHMRQVRNIQFDHQDLAALVTHPQNHLKLTNTPIDVFGAILQQNQEPIADFFMLSSWLGPLAQGVVKNTDSIGTLETNLAAACPGNSTSELLTRDFWCIPLCGGRPLHWVLCIVNFRKKRIELFDSLPELRSARWAKSMAISIVDAALRLLDKPTVDWSTWGNMLHAPPPEQGQSDSWSCGIFVMMAMQAFVEKASYESCTHDQVQTTRVYAMRIMMDLPIVRTAKDKPESADEGDSDVEMHDGGVATPRAESVEGEVENSDSLPMADAHSSGDPGPEVVIPDAGKVQGASEVTANRRPRAKDKSVWDSFKNISLKRRSSAVSESDQYETDGEAARRDKVKRTKKRSKKLTPAQRQEVLEADELILAVKKDQVRCSACTKWVKLNSKRDYDAANWNTHKGKCPSITGEKKKRINAVKPVKLLGSKGDQPIRRFFNLKSSAGADNPRLSDETTKVRVAEPTQKIKYIVKTVHLTPHSTLFEHFSLQLDGSYSLPAAAPLKDDPSIGKEKLCTALSGPRYEEYALRTHTRSLGGVSAMLRARTARRIFPYKPFPLLKKRGVRPDADLASDDGSKSSDNEEPADTAVKHEIPDNGNTHLSQTCWTRTERQQMDAHLKAFARWEVEYETRTVRSTVCSRLTFNVDGRCDACASLLDDSSLKDAIRRKVAESKLPEEEQREKEALREKFAPTTFRSVEDRTLQAKLRDPLLRDLFSHLERDQNTGCFLKLYKYALDGKLKNFQTFTDICDVLADRIRRLSDPNGKLKFGQRYPQNYLNFMTLLRSYGQQSARQYAIVTAQIGGPSARHLRTLVSKSEDALQNPDLVFENVARMKRFIDAIKYAGPVAFAEDCTKVRPRLSYSNNWGGHVLGSTFPLEECAVETSEDIDDVISRAKDEKAIATQVRAILAKVPVPRVPPQVVALLPTTGADDSIEIHKLHLLILKMAAQLHMKIISFAADGAASELAAQSLMDAEKTGLLPVVYEHLAYGISIKAVVFEHTGPLVSITDPPHAVKTARNQPQHGTHTASMGTGYLVNHSLVDLYETGQAGLVLADVKDVDKQDDGAARRLFHHKALLATTYEDDGQRLIRKDMNGLFVYLFVLGELFDAWLNRKLDVKSRILSAFRARFFLHIWRNHIVNLSAKYPDLYSTTRSFISPASFNIFNRLCDSLVALALIYATYYPTIPFCPWLLGTEFVEHFFGLARRFLPNFTYTQFLTMVKHVMLRQRILLSGKFEEKLECTSRSGYVFDFDNSSLTDEDLARACVQITPAEIDVLVELGHTEAVRISRDILHMPVPSLPFQLAPLSGPPRAKQRPKQTEPLSESEDDVVSDSDVGEGTEDELTDALRGMDLGDDDVEIPDSIKLASADAARDSALDDAYDTVLKEAGDISEASAIPTLKLPPMSIDNSCDSSEPPVISSQLVEGSKISIQRVTDLRQSHQAITAVRSQRTVMLDPKFSAAIETTEKQIGMSLREASHRVRIAQDVDPALRKPKTDRERRWKEVTTKRVLLVLSTHIVPNLSTKNVNTENKLTRGCAVIVRTRFDNGGRFYIGEVLDIYKKGMSNRHGSMDLVDTLSGLSFLSLRVYLPITPEQGRYDDDDDDDDIPDVVPAFSCLDRRAELHTHGKSGEVIYNLGLNALLQDQDSATWRLASLAGSRWKALTRPKVNSILKSSLKLKIPGGASASKK